MIVTWEVEDGYVGKSAPHKTEIPDFVLDACENDQEKQTVIDEYVQEDFNQKISWYITGE